VPLEVILSVFASFAILSVFLVLLIKPRNNLEPEKKRGQDL